MLSIILCSINADYLNAVSKNITETIDIEYEILAYDNSKENLGICAVYNMQAALAKYPYLLFLHEDVIFRTKNWGQILIDIFINNPKAGLVGLAGSSYKSKMYSGWYTAIPNMDAYNILHNINGEMVTISHRPSEADLFEVVCLDGVFIASKKRGLGGHKI